ncbi:uncharacterized protein LJ206_006414 isoform 1-T1 [Theristicus caerulescens]
MFFDLTLSQALTWCTVLRKSADLGCFSPPLSSSATAALIANPVGAGRSLPTDVKHIAKESGPSPLILLQSGSAMFAAPTLPVQRSGNQTFARMLRNFLSIAFHAVVLERNGKAVQGFAMKKTSSCKGKTLPK